MAALITEMINFPSDGRITPGYLARPVDGDTHPGLVVIQEWWGLVPHIKQVAERFAGEGFVALAPDLYYGETADEPDEARKLAMQLDRDRAVREITAAAQYLKSRTDVKPKKIGAVGWCMGGGLALSAATHNGDIGAAVAFYGRPLAEGDTAKIQAPVLGLYGEDDLGIPVETVKAFERELEIHGIPHEIRIYPGAGHAFFNDTRPGAFHAEAALDAWQRTLAWYRRYLV
jgi:carboxymethylenebutenolidase